MANRIVVCTWGRGRNGLPTGAEALLTLARKASQGLGTDVSWLHLGALPEAAASLAERHGVSLIEHIGDPSLDALQPDPLVEALGQYHRSRAPGMMLLAQTFEARLLAPRVAGRCGAGVVMNAVDIEPSDPIRITTSAYGGDTRVVHEVRAPSCVLGVLFDSIEPTTESEVSSPPIERIDVDLTGVTERIRVIEPPRSVGPKLEDAQIIVAGGRGLGKKENFQLVEELAAALGGMAGASRPIVDDGWTDSSRQVGLTGKITRPVLYIAAGVSGASQHMVGCSAAKTLVAINKDPDAAIFRYARYGIVADCTEVLPALTRALKG